MKVLRKTHLSVHTDTNFKVHTIPNKTTYYLNGTEHEQLLIKTPFSLF